MKLIKSDIVVTVILLSAWLFYLIYGGSTRFDVNQTVTLTLLVAAEFTALAILYAAGRYFTAKKGRLISKDMSNLIRDQQAKQTELRKQ